MGDNKSDAQFELFGVRNQKFNGDDVRYRLNTAPGNDETVKKNILQLLNPNNKEWKWRMEKDVNMQEQQGLFYDG